MTKSGRDIEDDFYFMVEQSDLPSFVGGKLYKKRRRPFSSNEEDIVVGFLRGLDGQNQEGYVNINIYVPNINTGSKDGKKYSDDKRIRMVESRLLAFVEGISSTDYDTELDQTIQEFEVEGLEQMMVNARIKFKRTTL